MNNSAEDNLIKAMNQYLRSKGWKPAVGGRITIQQQPSALKYNFELVVHFTGVPPEEHTNAK